MGFAPPALSPIPPPRSPTPRGYTHLGSRGYALPRAYVVETVPLSQSLDEELGVFEAEPTLAEELEDLLSVEDSEVEGEEDGGDELE
jgi:hypothetical protein